MDELSPHRRYDLLADRWILVSPQRDQRPWQGQQEPAAPPQPAFDPNCYLCPGNQRAGGQQTPDYDDVYAFDNDFPALLPTAENADTDDHLLGRRTARGRCRVICYSPRHDQRLADMTVQGIRRVIDLWACETRHLSATYRHVQVFENRGATMGCSNAHPHGQIWALDDLPSNVAVEDEQQRCYHAERGRVMLLDYLDRELSAGERIVLTSAHWVVVVPWWASWPFETLVLPCHWVPDIPSLTNEARDDLAWCLKQLLQCYDRLFDTPFPYSMGWHGAPGDTKSPHWLLHGHFYPPLLRSASVRKHMVGFEMLGEPQRDLTPETAASRLRSVLT